MNHWVSCSLADLSWTQLQVGFRSFILFGQWLFRHTILRAKVKSTRRQAQWQKDIQSPFFKPWSKQIINQSQNQSAGKHPPPIIRPNQVIWPSPTSIGWESVFLPWGKGEEEESEYLLNHNLINHRNVTCILQIRKLRSLVQSAELGNRFHGCWRSLCSFIQSLEDIMRVKEWSQIIQNHHIAYLCSSDQEGVINLVPVDELRKTWARMPWLNGPQKLWLPKSS